MPVYVNRCDCCGLRIERFGHIDDPDPECNCSGAWKKMDWLPERVNNKPFTPFTTPHLKKYTGGKEITFNSLAEIRAFEKQHGVLWECGSYDSRYHDCDV